MRRRTIHDQMVVRLVLTVTIAITFIFILSSEAIRTTIQSYVHQDYKEKAMIAASEVDGIIRQQKVFLETYARMIQHSYARQDSKEERNKTIEKFANQTNPYVAGYWYSYQSNYEKQGKYTSWYGYNLDGKLQGITIPEFIDESSAKLRDDPRYDYYHGPVKKGSTYITSPYLDHFTHFPVISISTPVYDHDNQLIGVAGVDLRFQDLSHISSHLSIHPKSKVVLLNKTGQLLLDTDASDFIWDDTQAQAAEAQSQHEFLLTINEKQITSHIATVDDKGEQKYMISTPIKEAEWQAIVLLPTKVVDQTLMRVFFIIFCIWVALLISIYAFVHWWIKRFVTSPLRSLVEASQRIAAGDLSGQISVRGDNEWGELTQNMNDMLVTMRQQAALEQEIKRMSALKIVGEMAAAISHEIRNPLTTVRGFLQLLRNKPEHEHEHVYFDTMMDEIIRANTIITEYLTLAQHKIVEFQPKSINDIIEHIYPLVQATATVNCQHIELNLKSVPYIMLDEKEIRQLLHNIIRNGLEAMEANKILRIRTRHDGSRVILEVEDEGAGFDPSVLQQAGTPFITTKETGTGLGLAICYSIVQRHGGIMTFHSQPGCTIVSISLPIEMALHSE
ncbi:ATP-binding protein [Paenibacillus agilis]|uniref:histidine kinase n=1 Tax=Paenibacillus agilis TaxID=3020863 RepID=A0A559IZU7_9BACL|nr:ATP-binding protein [Paenibacillus agilis]TVX93133.1 sensor histidine kinase [Paenibacillus agilis]